MFERGAELGDAESQCRLAIMHQMGLGGTKDFDKASK